MNCIKDGKYTGDSCFGCKVSAVECEIRDKVYRNRWIPVSERLPGQDFQYFNVTIKLPSGNDIVEYCLYKQSERKFYIVADGNLELNQAWEEEAAGVIAWQPLPEPYKEEKSEII